MRVCLAALTVTILVPRALCAQFGTIEEVAKRFTDIGLFMSYGGFHKSKELDAGRRGSERDSGLLSYGAEFALGIGDFRRPICARGDGGLANTLKLLTKRDTVLRDSLEGLDQARSALAASVRALVMRNRALIDSLTKAQRPPETCVSAGQRKKGQRDEEWPVRKCTYALKELRIRRDAAGRADTVRVEGTEQECKPAKDTLLWVFELGFSYGYTTHFHSGISGLGLRGALKEVPGVTIYATYQPCRVSPYFGVRTGLIKLDDLTLTSDTLTFSAAAQSVQIGVVAGLVTDQIPVVGFRHRLRLISWPFNTFVEGSYMYRVFPSVKSSTPVTLPDAAPKRLNMSGWSIGSGIQFPLGNPDNKD